MISVYVRAADAAHVITASDEVIILSPLIGFSFAAAVAYFCFFLRTRRPR